MSSIFGAIGVETPKFEVLRTLGVEGTELRKYGPQIRAEVTYETAPGAPIMDSLNNPFRSLAGYIFGGNTSRTKDASEKVAMTSPVVMQTTPSASAPSSEKIAMTSPVVMQSTGGDDPASSSTEAAAGSGKRTMCFIMPSQFKSVEELPVPKNTNVRLMEVPERTFAAIRFRGNMSQQVQRDREAELRKAAEREGVKLSSNPHDVQYCGYNPPWCLPWLKTNDILIPIVESS